MEERRVEVRIIRAENLEDVNRLSRMKTYAVARVSPIGMTYKTKVDEEGGVNPYWPDGTFHFSIPEAYLRDGKAKLTVEIWTKGTINDREVGEVMIPLTEAAAGPSGVAPSKVAPRIYTLRSKTTGEPHGQVYVALAYGTRAVHETGRDAGLTSAPVERPAGPGSTLPAPARVPDGAATHLPVYNPPPRPQPPPHQPPPSYHPPPSEPPSYYHPPSPSYPPASLPPPDSELPPSYYHPPSPSYPPASLPPPDSQPPASYYPPPLPSYHPPPSEPPLYYPPPPRTPPRDRRLPVIEPPFDDHKPFIVPSNHRLTPNPPHNLPITSPPGPGTPGAAISVSPPAYYVSPATSTTGAFSSPLGKVLLTDVNAKIRPQRQY